jgi:heme exporter protein A
LTLRRPYHIFLWNVRPKTLAESARLMILLEAKNLGKWFGRRKVFDGLDFLLEEGSSLVVTGKNGSGKTTLLKILCGLIRPTAGEVSISDSERKVTRQESRNLFGLVMPDLELYGELTAVENLLFLSRIQGANPDRETVEHRLAQVGLENRENDLVLSFSSGMKQRLKYAFALLRGPKILLLDEPTANMDQEGASLADQVIDSQRRRGIVIIATNDRSDLRHAEQTIQLGD